MEMIALIIVLAVILLLGYLIGYLEVIHFGKLSYRNVLVGLLVGAFLIALLGFLYGFEIISEAIARQSSMGLYTLVSGFFLGAGTRNVSKRMNAGFLRYANNSFSSETLPNLISTLFFAYGIYKTGILTEDAITGLRITSGVSLVGLGFYGFSLRLVPEFRNKGVLLLDRFIHWKHVLSFEWHSEQVLAVDYMLPDKHISEFRTLIPIEDRKEVEELLNKMIEEYKQEENFPEPD